MTKYVPKKLTQLSANESAAIDIINQNLDSIQEYIDDSASRTGKSPAQMQTALDMNGQKILNLGTPTQDTDVVRLKDVVENKEEIKQMVNTASVAVTQALDAAETATSAAADMSDQVQLARDWATKTNGPVEGGEYSSKYYAENIGADVHTVAGIATDVTAVASNATNINAVASDISNVNSVAGDLTNIDTVASNSTNVNTVATNMSDVNSCATNMAAIQDAPNQAASAAASAEAAAQSASVSNPPPLLSHQWTDHLLNDIRYLRADTFSWQSGLVYTAAYNHLVADIDGVSTTTETVGSYTITYYPCADGHKIVDASQETMVDNIYNESGVAWYYILDTANQRFKLPRELPITDKSKGNGTAVGMTDGTNNYGMIAASGSGFSGRTGAYGENVGGTGGTENVALKVSGLTTDSTKSGIISHRANENGQQYLYFYVGQYTQSATEQTAGLNAELFNGKADIDLNNLSASGIAKFTAKLDADKIQQVSTLPANPVAGTLYLIPE